MFKFFVKKSVTLWTCEDSKKRAAQNARLFSKDMPWLFTLRTSWDMLRLDIKVINLKQDVVCCPFWIAMRKSVSDLSEIWIIKGDETSVEATKVPFLDPHLNVAEVIFKHDLFKVNAPINCIILIKKQSDSSVEQIQVFRVPKLEYPNAKHEFEDRIWLIANHFPSS